MADRLTGKQQRFVVEYLKCLNATEAARRSGYEGDDNTLSSVGYENLRKPDIASRIEEEFTKHKMTAAEVLYHLSAIGRADVDDVLDDKGNIDLLKARARGKTGIIKKIKSRMITTEDSDIVETEVEPMDKVKALELLAKYHDLINKIRIDDWRTQAIADIRAGNLPFEALADAFDESLATELFRAAGVPISTE
jgi:phage terminase small subunit